MASSLKAVKLGALECVDQSGPAACIGAALLWVGVPLLLGLVCSASMSSSRTSTLSMRSSRRFVVRTSGRVRKRHLVRNGVFVSHVPACKGSSMHLARWILSASIKVRAALPAWVPAQPR